MAENSNNTFLDRFAINLNQRAAQGKMDPVSLTKLKTISYKWTL